MFTPAKLLDTGGTLYLVATKTKVDQFGAVFEALMAQIVHEVEIRSAARNGRPIPTGLALILEEAANIARLPNLPYMASALRGLGVLLMTVWQNEAQIEELYGPAKARTILANHLWKVYLPGTTDDATLKSLSEQIGTYQRTETTISTGHDGRISTSHRITDAPAAPITDLQTMPADTAIAISGRRRPIRLRTRGWYQDPHQRRLIDPVVAAQFDTDFAPRSTAPAATRASDRPKRAGRGTPIMSADPPGPGQPGDSTPAGDPKARGEAGAHPGQPGRRRDETRQDRHRARRRRRAAAGPQSRRRTRGGTPTPSPPATPNGSAAPSSRSATTSKPSTRSPRCRTAGRTTPRCTPN